MDYHNCKDLPVWAQILLHQEPAAAGEETPAKSREEKNPVTRTTAA